MAIVGGVKDAGGGAAGGEEDVGFVWAAEGEGRIAGGEEAFGRQGSWLGGLREFGPVFAVFGVEDGKFAVDGIADSEAVFFGAASKCVEKEGGTRIGVLRAPGFAGVERFVDVGFIVVADGEDVGDVRAEGLDAAEVLGIGVVDVEAGPGFPGVRRAEDDAVTAGGPDGCLIAYTRGGEAAEAGVFAGVEGLGSWRLWRRNGEEREEEERNG